MCALTQIWDLADPGGKGCLDKQAFFISLKLVALAQNGKEVNLNNLCLPMPVPDMVRWLSIALFANVLYSHCEQRTVNYYHACPVRAPGPLVSR